MVAASLTNIFLMFLLLQVGNSCAQPPQGEKKPPAVKEILIQLTGSSLMKLKEEINHDISATSELKNSRPGGRKMMLKTVFNNEQHAKKDTSNVEDTDNSGKDIYASKNHSGKSHHHLTNQNERNMAAFARRLLHLPAGTRQDCFQHSSTASTKCIAAAGSSTHYEMSPYYEAEASHHQNLETQKLTYATDEILNLMNKDYQGGGGPRHKPPINNYDPLGQEHVKP